DSWKSDANGSRCEDVAEAKVDLHRDPCGSKCRRRCGSHPFVESCLGNTFCLHARRVEDKPVVDTWYFTDLRNNCADVFQIVAQPGQQVDVTRGSSRRRVPNDK